MANSIETLPRKGLIATLLLLGGLAVTSCAGPYYDAYGYDYAYGYPYYYDPFFDDGPFVDFDFEHHHHHHHHRHDRDPPVARGDWRGGDPRWGGGQRASVSRGPFAAAHPAPPPPPSHAGGGFSGFRR